MSAPCYPVKNMFDSPNYIGLILVTIVLLVACSNYMNHVVRKPAFCICENIDADQLRGNREADQRLCFHYIDSTIPLLPKYEILSL